MLRICGQHLSQFFLPLWSHELLFLWLLELIAKLLNKNSQSLGSNHKKSLAKKSHCCCFFSSKNGGFMHNPNFLADLAETVPEAQRTQGIES